MAADLFASQRKTLERQLLDAQAPSGAWPYYRNQMPRIEPTAWALIALTAQAGEPSSARQRAIEQGFRWLGSLQQPSGRLLEPGVPVENYGFNGLALIAAEARSEGRAPFADALAAGLLDVKGVKLEGDPKVVRQNSALQAWSWIEGTFSWIEPTAYCLIALKRRKDRSPLAAVRIAEAQAVILDRVCDSGGWNYGNAQVLSQDLRAYVPTTALALLAMHDEAAHPAVQKSLAWLEAHALSERSTLALSLAAIALHTFRRDASKVLHVLAEVALGPQSLGNPHVRAMALYAFGIPITQSRAFGGAAL